MSDRFYCCVLIGLSLLGFAAGYSCSSADWRKWSTEVNAAHYDPVTGEWTAGPRPVNPECERKPQ